MISLSKTHLEIQYLPVSSLSGNKRNPRRHSKKQINQLINSIRQFGFVTPLLIDDRQHIIAGHCRLMAAREIGMKEVPTISLEHLSSAEAQAYMIADNRLTENASWDDTLLAEHFQELAELNLDFDLEITGFDVGEIDLLIEGASATQDEEEKPLPPSNSPTISQPGDLWLLGKHRLYHGSALEVESYDRLMGKRRAAMVFTDPPYNVPINGFVGGLGKVKHREFSMASGEMTVSEFIDFLRTSCGHMARYSRDGALHYICMDWRHMKELLSAGNEIYNDLKAMCVWVKDNGGMGSFYRSRHELVFVFKHGDEPYLNNVELGSQGRYRTNVWEYAGCSSFARKTDEGDLLELHPTVKPVGMIADAILDCTRRGNIVLEPFLGSGSTLIAAEKTGRRCHGIEIDAVYVETSIRRWQQWTGDQAMHADTGKPFDDMTKEACHE